MPSLDQVVYWKYLFSCAPAVVQQLMESEMTPERKQQLERLNAQADYAFGLAKGREEGREEGQRRLLAQILVARFGALPDEVEAGLQRVQPAALEALATIAVTAPDLATVQAAIARARG